MKRSVLVLVCLLLVSAVPVASAQDSDTSPDLRLGLDVQGDQPLRFDAISTFHPVAPVNFTLTIRNAGGEDADVQVGDPVGDLVVDDVFGATAVDADVDPLVTPGSNVTVPAQGEVAIAEFSWSPSEDFDARDSVVAYYAASATAHLDGRDDLDRTQRFRLEQRDLRVDAYERRLKVYRYPYDDAAAFSFRQDDRVPVRLQNLGEENLSGTFRFTVRDADGQVYASEEAQVDIGTAPDTDTHRANWSMVDDAGDRAPPGTYLIRAEVEVDGTVHYDEFPATLVRERTIADPVQVHVRTENLFYEAGETVRFTVNATNVGDVPERLRFDTAQRVDVVVTRNDSGKIREVWRYSENRSFAQQTGEVTLDPGRTRSWQVAHTFTEPGSYQVRAKVVSDQPREALLHGAFNVLESPTHPEKRTCKEGPSQDLRIAVTDADGRDRSRFRPGQTVQVDIANVGPSNYSAGADVEIVGPDGRTVFEEIFEMGVTLHPDQAWTASWNQEDPDGDQVENGTYRVHVSAEGGTVGFAIEIGPTDGASGSSEGRISGETCRYSVPTYFREPLGVWTEEPTVEPGEAVRIRYRVPEDLDGRAQLWIRSGDDRLVHAAEQNVSLQAGETGSFTWDQTGRDGEGVSVGAYIATVRAEGRSGMTVVHVGPSVPEPPEDARTPPAVGGWSRAEMRSALHAMVRSELDRPLAADETRDGFQRDGTLVQGDHVTFRYDVAGNLTGYSVDGTTLFERVSVDAFDRRDPPEPLSNPIVAGPHFALIGESSAVSAVDARPAPLMVRAAEARSVNLVLADDLTADADAAVEGCARVNGNVSALVCAQYGGSVDVDGRVVGVELPAGGQLMVVRLPNPASAQHDVTREIAAGRIGLQIDVEAGGTAQSTVFGAGFRAVQAEPVEGGVSVAVERSVHEGAAVTLNVPPETLETTDPAEIGVLLDGEEVPRASSLESVARCEGDDPSYVVILGRQAGQERAQVVVCVPHFSQRTIAVQNLAQIASSPQFQLALTQAFLVAAVVTLAAAVAVFRQP